MILSLFANRLDVASVFQDCWYLRFISFIFIDFFARSNVIISYY